MAPGSGKASKPAAAQLTHCGICYYHYDDNDHAPLAVDCSHPVCKTCLEKLVQNYGQQQSFPCPICPGAIAMKPGGVGDYEPHAEATEALGRERPKREQGIKCHIHHGPPITEFCISCKECICIVDKKAHRGKGHVKEDIKQLYARFDRETAIRERFLTVTIPEFEKCTQMEKQLRERANRTKQEIKKLEEDEIQYIRKESQRLCAKVEDFYERSREFPYTDLREMDSLGIKSSLRTNIDSWRQHDLGKMLHDVPRCNDDYGYKSVMRSQRLREYRAKLDRTYFSIYKSNTRRQPLATVVQKERRDGDEDSSSD